MKRALLLIVLAWALDVCAQPAGSLADYIYTPPAGWTVTPYPDGILISTTVAEAGEKCILQLWPMRSTSGDLERDALGVFAEVFKAFEPRAANDGGTPGSIIKGASAQGWDYFMVKQPIGLPGYRTVFGFAFVAKLESRIAALSGISKDPLESFCFGLLVKDEWPKFFYSLQFRNWKPQPGRAPLAAKLPGVWMAASATAGSSYVFAGNGRYASTAAAQRYVRSGTDLLRITDAYFGDGAYRLNGHQIVMTSDGKPKTPETGWLRIEQESKDQGRTWVEKLYLLQTSVIDGREYEVIYTRQNN